MKKKAILIALLSGFALYSFANDTSNQATGERIVAYSKDGTLYRSEMYLAGNTTPSLVNEYVAGDPPKGAIKHIYHSFGEFIQAKPTLDLRYSQLISKAKSKTMDLATADTKVSYAFDPSVNIYAHTGPEQCYKSDPQTGGGSQYTSKMVALNGNMSLDATLNIDKDLRLFAITEEGIGEGKGKFILNLHYKGDFNYGDYNFIGAVLAPLYTGIPSENNLTDKGYGTFNNSRKNFLAQCGSAGIDGFLGGLIASSNIKIISTNHKYDYDLKTDLNASVDIIDRLVTKIHSLADAQANISRVTSTFNFKGDIVFNQPIEGTYTFSEYIGKKIDENKSYETQCEVSSPITPNLTACATYIGNVSNAINSGLLRANGSIPNNPSAVATLEPFPYGVNISGITPPKVSFGSNNPYISYSEAHDARKGGILISDPFSYIVQDSLKKDRTLIFQLGTLAERARFLANTDKFGTKEEGVLLNNLANYYEEDLQALLKAGKSCYGDTVDAYTIFPSYQCNTVVKLSDNQEIKLSDLPTSVYQLYSKDGITPKDSLQEFLYKNSIALQYQANYSEEFSGLSDGNDSKSPLETVRAANQIQFAGVVFYNAKYNIDEFFAKNNTLAGKDKSFFRGYILAGISRVRLGKADNEQNNVIGGKPGMKWWQFHKSAYDAIRKSEVYEPAQLYFVINNSSLLPLPLEADKDKTPQNVIFNKIIGDNTLTADSTDFTKDTNARMVSFKLGSSYNHIDLDKLANGISKLPVVAYNITSNVLDLTNNREKFGVSCTGGIYLAKIDFPNKSTQAKIYDKATFGSTNPNDYLCYRAFDGSPNNKWTYFKMGQNGNIAYRTSDLKENITLELKPIAPFF